MVNKIVKTEVTNQVAIFPYLIVQKGSLNVKECWEDWVDLEVEDAYCRDLDVTGVRSN